MHAGTACNRPANNASPVGRYHITGTRTAHITTGATPHIVSVLRWPQIMDLSSCTAKPGSVEEGRGGRHAQADPKRARTPPLPPALARQRRWALLLPHPCLLLAQAPLQLSFRVFPRCAICPLQLPLKDCRCVRGRARQDNSAEKELDSQEEEREEMEKKEGGALSARSRRHRAPVTYKEEEDEVVVSDGEEASEQEGKCAAEDASSGEADAADLDGGVGMVEAPENRYLVCGVHMGVLPALSEHFVLPCSGGHAPQTHTHSRTHTDMIPWRPT